MNIAEVVVFRSKINKNLLNSLPKNWDMNVSVIKNTKDLSRLTLAEVMAIIKACDMDDKQREINHVNSYSTANLGASTNGAFSTIPTHHAPSSMGYQMASSSSSSTSKPTTQSPAVNKGSEEHMLLMESLAN